MKHLLALLVSCLSLAVLVFAKNDTIKAAAWYDATDESLARARACLPTALVGIYSGNLTAATLNATDSNARRECEQALLFYMYERLSVANDLCTAFAHGLRICAHYIRAYDNEKGTIPSALPRQSLVVTRNLCTFTLTHLGNRTLTDEIFDNFRYRFSPGVNCLRSATVHGLVQTYLI